MLSYMHKNRFIQGISWGKCTILIFDDLDMGFDVAWWHIPIIVVLRRWREGDWSSRSSWLFGKFKANLGLMEDLVSKQTKYLRSKPFSSPAKPKLLLGDYQKTLCCYWVPVNAEGSLALKSENLPQSLGSSFNRAAFDAVVSSSASLGYCFFTGRHGGATTLCMFT